MKTTAELREGFLAFFEERGHLRVPVVAADPACRRTLDALHLRRDAAAEAVLLRPEGAAGAALHDRPEVLRAGGKDTDLDEVGLTARHASMFEMLGNFSFGDYFKDGAIDYAWEFVTEQMRLEPERLWATVSRATRSSASARTRSRSPAGCARASRASGSSRSRAPKLLGPRRETGPCGPCSELHYDRGEEHGCGQADCGPNCERCDRFIEFWNLVFMEYDLHADGSLTPLPKQNIDTGMGLERSAMLLQERRSIFDTDGFRLIMDWIEQESGVSLRRVACGHEGAPGDHRPRPRHDVPGRGGITPRTRAAAT